MTERKTLYNGVSNAAWGYFFLYFDVNFGTVSILPRFVGWLLFLAAIQRLKEERRDLALLRPLALLLALWSAADWLASWVGADVDGLFPPLDLIAAVAGMYFHFQLFTDFAALAAAYQRPEDHLDSRLLRWRTVQTVLLTVIALSLYAAEWMGGGWTYAAVALAAAYLIVGLCLMVALFALRRLFREEEAPGERP